jgi:hypothetical protein
MVSQGGEYEEAVFRAIALMMEAASTSETSSDFYQTTRRNNPEHSHLCTGKFNKICEIDVTLGDPGP